MRLFEWHEEVFEHADKLNDFIEYLSGVWKSRNRYVEAEDDSEEERQEEELQKQRFFDFTYDNKISARNFVGVVQYEDIRIEVYPKLFSDQADSNVSKWQMNLLFWLMYCRKIKYPFAFADVSKLRFDDFLELLIYVFANYTEQTLAQQPYQAYQKVEEETTYLKGRLSFDDYIKHNVATGKFQNFYCIHEPFVYDNLFNRIIKYVTRRLMTISNNALNKAKLNEILFLLDDVSDIPCIATDCEKVRLNPLYQDHKHILELCKLYLSNQIIDMDNDDSRNFCFLVPMEYIFEDFVFGFLSDKWPWLNISSQSTDFLAFNEGKKVFQIRNDIYINHRLIIDTKYKIRYPTGARKASVSQNDIYQMVSYAVRRNCVDVLLLYPKLQTSINTPTSFKIPSELLSNDLNISVKTIDITFDNIHTAEAIIYDCIKEIHPIFFT